jgi:hypothetical protein
MDIGKAFQRTPPTPSFQVSSPKNPPTLETHQNTGAYFNKLLEAGPITAYNPQAYYEIS